MRIALAGNPNSGKTTMYNVLTGKNEKVGNWTGVTVDKKEAPVKKIYAGGRELTAVDLPGAYSMSPFTSEESITSAYIQEESPDVIINIVDATNLSRSLFFTTQLLELGIPLVIALNKADVNEKRHTVINTALLSETLGCPVIETVSTDSQHEDVEAVVAAAVAAMGKAQMAPYAQGEVDLKDKEAVEAADRKRFAFVNKVVSQVENRRILSREQNIGDKIDDILTNKWLGIPIFAAVMWLVFKISQEWLGIWIAEGVEIGGVAVPGLVTLIEMFGRWVGSLLQGASPFVSALVVDGIIGGVGAVVGFLPLVMVMYFCIAILEDCGYMARVAVVMDPIFKRVGLSGRSVIPFVMGIGCAVPGVMAARTIRDERERRATAMLTPFMPCGAKLPVIMLFAGAFFDNNASITYIMYLVGIVIIFFGALLVNQITGHKARKSFFIIELPEYKAPSVRFAFYSMCSRGWAYIVKAGTIILLCNTVVQVMQTFGWNLQPVEDASASILASVASPFAYLLVPVVGYHAWQLAAAAVTGFIAKENVVATLAVCYGFVINDDLEVESGNQVVDAMRGLTKVAALAYLMFNLYSPPCFAAIGAMNAEIKSAKWMWGAIGLQLGVGFTVGILVYQIGTLIVTGSVGAGFLPGMVFLGVFAAVLAAMMINTNKSLKKEITL